MTAREGLLEDKPPEQIIVRELFDPQRMIAESGRHRLVVQVTARNGSNWQLLVMVSIPSCSHHGGSRPCGRIFDRWCFWDSCGESDIIHRTPTKSEAGANVDQDG